MKKIMMGAAVLALLDTGCQNETLVEQSQSQEGQLFTLEVSKGVSSRTELGKNNATNWSTDDAIYVSGEAGGVRGVLQFAGFVDGNKSKALFKGYIFGGQPSKLQHIVFPAPKDGKIDMSARTPGKLDAPMIGTINPSGTVQTLNNVGGLLAFKMLGGEGNVYGVSAEDGPKNMTGGYYTFNAESGTLVYTPVDKVTPAMVMEDGYVYIPVATTTTATNGTGTKTDVTVDVIVTNLESTTSIIESTDVNITSGEIMGDNEDTGLDTGVIEGENGAGAVKATIVSSSEELAEAVKAGVTDFFLMPGQYNIYGCAKQKLLNINGTKEAILTPINEGERGCDYGFDGTKVVFNNITINTSLNKGTYPGYARMSATYNKCTIEGTYVLYGDGIFNYCTLNVSGDKYNIWTWGAPNATFTECTFNSDGKALLLYGQVNTKLTIEGCIFNDNGGLTDKKAAIEIGNDYNKSYVLIVNKTTVNGYEINDKGVNTGTTLWANKNSMSQEQLNVIVDGVDVY